MEAGTEPEQGETLYGVFLQACNRSGRRARDRRRRSRSSTTRATSSSPRSCRRTTTFAYHARELLPDECIPEAGSVAQLGPTAGSMLLFRLPIENTEYRPLELEIEGTGDEHLTFELDI